MGAVELTGCIFGLFYHLMVINPTNFFSGMLKRVCIKLPSLPYLCFVNCIDPTPQMPNKPTQTSRIERTRDSLATVARYL